MRFLADENIPSTAVVHLREHGHDVVSMRDVEPGAGDEKVIAAAVAGRSVLLTLDKDFGERVFLHGEQVPGLVLFRQTGAIPRAQVSDWIVQVVLSRSDWEGAFSVVTGESRIRMKPLKNTAPAGQNL